MPEHKIFEGGLLIFSTWYKCPACDMYMLFDSEDKAPVCYRCGGKVYPDAN